MSQDFDIDPWNGLFVYLSATKLTVNEKSWLGREVAFHRQTPISLAKRFNLNRNTIQWYRRLIRKGKIPKSCCGRPERSIILDLLN
jgi:hypothetical protein